jgi:hypothetical protein
MGSGMEEVAGGWRRLHNEELHNLQSSQNISRVIKSRRMIWAGHVTRMGGMRIAYIILVGKPDGKRPRRIPRRWENNIEGVWTGCIWLGRDQWPALVNTVMNLQVP